MTIEAIGYGAGTMTFPRRANILRLFVGEAVQPAETELIALLETNLDDVTAETVRVKGQFLPFGDYRKNPGQGAVLLAGDAAGLVDPIGDHQRLQRREVAQAADVLQARVLCQGERLQPRQPREPADIASGIRAAQVQMLQRWCA